MCRRIVRYFLKNNRSIWCCNRKLFQNRCPICGDLLGICLHIRQREIAAMQNPADIIKQSCIEHSLLLAFIHAQSIGEPIGKEGNLFMMILHLFLSIIPAPRPAPSSAQNPARKPPCPHWSARLRTSPGSVPPPRHTSWRPRRTPAGRAKPKRRRWPPQW